jgi:integrase
MSVHQTKTGAWFVIYRPAPKAKQKKEWFGRGELNRLRAIKRDEEIKILTGRAKEEAVTFKELASLYHLGHSRQDSTTYNDHYKFKIILPLVGNHVAENLSPRILDDYVKARIEKSVKRSTISREIRLIRAVMSFAEQQDPPLIFRNPIARYKFKSVNDKEVPYPPSQSEIQRILNAAEPHLQRAILIMWHTGMRPGKEMLSLSWEDIDLAGRSMRVVSARKGGPAIRIVPIEGLHGHLERWFEQDRRAFEDQITSVALIHYRGQRIGSLKRAWSTAKMRAGITRKLRPYDLRHGFVTQALQSGEDLKSVSQIIGHSRPDTTLREYQHVTTEQHRKVVRNVPDLLVGVEQ